MSAIAKLKAERTIAVRDALAKARGSISAVAAKHLTPDRLLKVALAACQRSPKLLECNTVSLVQCVVGCAELGLEPNALGHAYLVPYGDTATLIIGYRGLLELAYRSGRILDITSECVFDGDQFDYKLGTDPFINHVPEGDTDANKVTHAYSIIRFKDGGQVMRVMTLKQLEAIRARSKASRNGPWVTDTVEMYRKTVLRNTLKYSPMSIELSKAESADIKADTGEETMADFEWIEVETVEPESEKGSSALSKKIGNPEAKQAERIVGDDEIIQEELPS